MKFNKVLTESKILLEITVPQIIRRYKQHLNPSNPRTYPHKGEKFSDLDLVTSGTITDINGEPIDYDTAAALADEYLEADHPDLHSVLRRGTRRGIVAPAETFTFTNGSRPSWLRHSPPKTSLT